MKSEIDEQKIETPPEDSHGAVSMHKKLLVTYHGSITAGGLRVKISASKTDFVIHITSGRS